VGVRRSYSFRLGSEYLRQTAGGCPVAHVAARLVVFKTGSALFRRETLTSADAVRPTLLSSRAYPASSLSTSWPHPYQFIPGSGMQPSRQPSKPKSQIDSMRSRT
jgi:hypothetical protein